MERNNNKKKIIDIDIDSIKHDIIYDNIKYENSRPIVS